MWWVVSFTAFVPGGFVHFDWVVWLSNRGRWVVEWAISGYYCANVCIAFFDRYGGTSLNATARHPTGISGNYSAIAPQRGGDVREEGFVIGCIGYLLRRPSIFVLCAAFRARLNLYLVHYRVQASERWFVLCAGGSLFVLLVHRVHLRRSRVQIRLVRYTVNFGPCVHFQRPNAACR